MFTVWQSNRENPFATHTRSRIWKKNAILPSRFNSINKCIHAYLKHRIRRYTFPYLAYVECVLFATKRCNGAHNRPICRIAIFFRCSSPFTLSQFSVFNAINEQNRTLRFCTSSTCTGHQSGPVIYHYYHYQLLPLKTPSSFAIGSVALLCLFSTFMHRTSRENWYGKSELVGLRRERIFASWLRITMP